MELLNRLLSNKYHNINRQTLYPDFSTCNFQCKKKCEYKCVILKLWRKFHRYFCSRLFIISKLKILIWTLDSYHNIWAWETMHRQTEETSFKFKDSSTLTANVRGVQTLKYMLYPQIPSKSSKYCNQHMLIEFFPHLSCVLKN